MVSCNYTIPYLNIYCMSLFVKKMGGIGKSRLITVIVPAGNTNPQISFPDQADLRYARILAIETFTVSDLAVSQPDGVTVLADANLKNVTVTFETNDSDDLQIY